MSGKSQNHISKLKHIRSGLAIYQTGRSPYWYVRLWDPVAKKYVRRSSKETSRIEATEAAVEFADSYRKKVDPSMAAAKDRSFETYARKLDAFNKAKGGNERSYSDGHKILFREGDGLISYFGKYDVGKITAGEMRDYLVHLDSRRPKPLANSTKAKQCMMVRSVLRLAFEDGLIDKLPEAPKLRTVDKPRVTFSEKDYKKLMTVARKCAERGDVVRGVKITHKHVHLFAFIVHSFLRPTEKELFGLRHGDVEVRSNPAHLVIDVHGGKTGFRKAATLSFAVLLYKGTYMSMTTPDPDQYVFMPEYKNRATAIATARRIFNHVLDQAGLKFDTNGNARSPYSLRHFAFQARLRGSKGQVNIYWLAQNAGTSVEQLERFYLKNMELSAQQVQNLQTLGDEG
ncbi:integrase [Phaeobacter gallaeciensis]|uniref:integrase n=1 Tax=Phaeobacter gallaeciensis TaxID=60890 RepID=UPI00237FA9A6|nr:integrase [Phaeobacter gallaeciensis]MDE4140001.1 integrase [Phaeobacter gallaeciensis]MDE4148389.1 integrase [Phaeobacter gallaeciensis]MDE4152667.1 integrase [Phaeobacter gallaeciensis]MDE4227999.1 integrase [Phaeobacter gallaeciensis]MDE4257132.1 integrase [Phaeobacter gallaeciensis]